MEKFWELFERSVIVQGLITTGLVGAVIYMTIAGREVPNELYTSLALVLGYYFGSKAQQVITASKTRK